MGRWKRRSTTKSKKFKINLNDSDESENDDNAENNKNVSAHKKKRQQPRSLTNTPSVTQVSSHSSSLSSQSSLNDRSSSLSRSNVDEGQQQLQSSEHVDMTDSPPAEVSISSTAPPTTEVTPTKLSTASRDPPTVTTSYTDPSVHSHSPPSEKTNLTTTATKPQLLPPGTRPPVATRLTSDMFPSKVDPRPSALFSTTRNSMLRSTTGGGARTILHYELIHEELMSVEDYLVDYATRKKEFDKKTDDKSSASSAPKDDDEPIVIGNQSFPALTPTILSQPYLSLPSTLESHERRVIHELCFSIGLYHATSHTTPPRLIVAIDSKGLCAAQGVIPPPVMPHIKEYRPWYYQKQSVKDDNEENENDYGDDDDDATDTQGNLSSCIKSFTPSEVVREEMNAHRAAINTLLMNPNRCIRPSDIIDFDEDLTFQKCAVNIVKSPQELETMMNEIAKVEDIGFGVWNYTESKYYEMTSLVLLSTATTSYIIDVTSQGVWGVVRRYLSQLFSNNDIVKVSYGGGGIGDYQNGVASLCRDFGLGVINHFDIREAALSMMMAVVASSDGIDYELLLRYYGLSEEDCERYKRLRELYGRKRKKGGRDGGEVNDPRRRPLTDDMISYMTYEVGYLVTLRRLMMRDITRYDFIGYDGETTPRNSDGENNVLMEVMERKSLGMYAPMSSSEDDVDGFWTPPDSDDEEGKEEEKQQQRVFDALHLGSHKEFLKVLVSSQKACLNFWQHKKEIPTHNSTWRSILSIHKAAAASKNQQQHSKFNQKQKQNLFLKLFQWRQQLASSLEVIPGSICSTEFLATVALKVPKSVEDVRRVAVFLPSMLLEDEDGYMKQIVEICNVVMEEERSSSEDEEDEDESGYVSDGSSVSGSGMVKGEVNVHHDATINEVMSPTASTDDGSEFEDCIDGNDNDDDNGNINNTSDMRQHNNINDKALIKEESPTNNKYGLNETNSKAVGVVTMITPPPMVNYNDETPKIGSKKRAAGSPPQQQQIPPENKDGQQNQQQPENKDEQQHTKENNNNKKPKIKQISPSPYTPIFQQPVPRTTLVVHDDYNNEIAHDYSVPVTETKITYSYMPNFLKMIFKKICCAVCIGEGNNNSSSSYHDGVSV